MLKFHKRGIFDSENRQILEIPSRRSVKVPGVVEVLGPLGVPGTLSSFSSRLSDQETVLSSPTRGVCAAFFKSSALVVVPFWCTVLMVRLAGAVSDCWLHQSMAFHLSASPPHQLESHAAESGTTRLGFFHFAHGAFSAYFVFSSRSLSPRTLASANLLGTATGRPLNYVTFGCYIQTQIPFRGGGNHVQDNETLLRRVCCLAVKFFSFLA